MEILIITIFMTYVIFNEFHKRKIKNSQKELQVPRDFYENLKEVIQYIDSTLESIKNKQENINKVFIKIQELKKEIEELESQKIRKSKKNKKEILEKKQENISSKQNVWSENDNKDLWEDLLNNFNKDRVDFSFRIEEKKEEIKPNENSSPQERESILTFLGRSFRKALGISSISSMQNFENNYLDSMNHKMNKDDVNEKIMSLEEFENSIVKDKTFDVIQTTQSINTQNSNLEKKIESESNIIDSKEDPRNIIIKESKKIFLELKTTEEKYRFVSKLFGLGFTKEEVQQITGFSTSEIILISNLKREK